MKSIKVLSIVVCILAIVLAGCSREKNDNNNPSVSEGQEQTSTGASAGDSDEVVPVENLVLIENNEFVPATLTVKKGTTVTWINKDQAEHWVVSDPHPTHSDLPDLNSKKGLLQNETYQFTFNEIGEFNYHDEKNNTITGTVVVE